MTPRDRKRERHRKERTERRRELSQRRAREAGAPTLRPKLAADDLRGLTPVEWTMTEISSNSQIMRRAREIWPDDLHLRKFSQKKILPSMVRTPAVHELSVLLTHAARTLCCDPPWTIPCVVLQLVGLNIQMSIERSAPTVESDPQRGRIGFWKLVRATSSGNPLPVWFTTHAVERMTTRLSLCEPVIRCYLADAWRWLVGDGDESERLRTRREITSRGGRPVLTIRMDTERAQQPLGYCPLEIADGRAIAKTFLEPWMPLGEEAPLSPEESTQRHEEYRSKTIAQAHDLFKAIALWGVPAERTQPVTIFLGRMVNPLSSAATTWVSLLRTGLNAAEAGSAEARMLLERGLDEREQAWISWSDELRRIWSLERWVKTLVAQARWTLAGLLERAADGAGQERAGPMRERAARERRTALEAEPGLVEG